MLVVCLSCACRVLVVCLSCACRVLVVCLSCACRVLVVCLSCVCRVFVVCLSRACVLVLPRHCFWRINFLFREELLDRNEFIAAIASGRLAL
jgi:hypothetical protein